MATLKALCVVAHPDDCVIFGYSYIHHHPEYEWKICYLTYSEWEPRARELKQFWQRRGISCIFLGYTDDYRDIERKKISFNEEQARRELGNIIRPYDLVLSHDSEGDYGHIHHEFVHDCVQHHPQLVTFARPGTGTAYILPATAYSLDELPLHADIITGFHPQQHQNSYKEKK